MTTSTDVAVPQQQSGDLAELHGVVMNAHTDVVADLTRWLEAASLAKRIADIACRGPFVPRAFQGKPEHAATAILAGSELGLSPGMALRSFHVIEGTASLSAKTMRALITSAGHELQIGENTAQKCVLRGRRRGETEWTEIEWTIEDAQRAQLTSKDVWKKYPKAMLLARCTTVLGDLKFGDVLAGMPCMEVLQDMDPVDITASVEVSQPAERPTRAAILAAAGQEPSPTAEVPAPGSSPAAEVAAPAPVERAVLPITSARWQAINAILRDLGVNGDGQQAARLRIVSKLAGRDHVISKGSDLTADEGRVVWDTLYANGPAICWEILGGDHTFPLAPIPGEDDAPAPAPAADSGEYAAGESAASYEDDPNGQWDGMDGAEAAAEGQ